MNVINKYLPPSCFSSKRMVPSAIVLHYISAINIDPDRKFDMGLCRKILLDYKLSAHYLIGRDGEIWDLVRDTNVAYHAGKSEYKGLSNWNNFSVGIEFIGTGDSGFTDEQYKSGSELVAYLIDQFSIGLIVGHEEISPGRKIDPGLSTGNFDLARIV